MVYIPDYYETDISEAITNTIVKGILVFGAFVSIILIVVAYKLITAWDSYEGSNDKPNRPSLFQ